MFSDRTNLLLVEDNPVDADLVEHHIQQAIDLAVVTHTKTLSEAISACKTQSFDAVLLDLNLPDSRGNETTANFCTIFNRLPVIVLTGDQEGEMGYAALAQGAQDYLSKDDVTPERLGRALQYAIERQKIRETLIQRNEELFSELKQQLEQLKLKTNFITSAVHQLHESTHLISSCVQSLKLAQEERNPRLRYQLLEQMEEGMEIVFKFLDALQVTTIDRRPGKSYQPGPIHLGYFCKQLISKTLKRSTQAIPIHPQGNGLFRTVALDPLLLEYILQNILDNAVQYSPKTGCIDFIIDKEEHWIHFSVRDRGIGIPIDEQDKVLEPFYRGTNGRVQVSGTGLGLAIAKTCAGVWQEIVEIEKTTTP